MRISDWSSDVCSSDLLATHIWLLLSCTVAVGALTSLYTAGLLPLTALTLSLVGFCTHPTAVCAAILISPGPGADILRGVPKSFHSRTRVNAFAGASKDMFRTLHLNSPHAPRGRPQHRIETRLPALSRRGIAACVRRRSEEHTPEPQ